MIPGGGDLSGLLAQAQAMQAQMMAAQEELAATKITGSSGGGLVKVTVSGNSELLSLEISPEACDPEDTEALADLVIAAVRDASHQAQQLATSKLGPMAGGGGMPDLGALGF